MEQTPTITTTAPLIAVEQVSKSFPLPDNKGEFTVLSQISLTIRSGEVVALLGRSGSGKSTLLRIMAGLITPSQGQVFSNGKPLRGANDDVAMVFQSFALLPWLTVLENVQLGLEARGIRREERYRRALKAIDLVGLDGFESAYPKELSGGMKQRVGFARAFVLQPQVLFMDEPFKSIDINSKINIIKYIKENYGDKYLPENARLYESKKKNVQDAHEAIRPTSMKYTPEFVKPFLNESQFKLYELIWKRFIASQMESAQLETTTITIKANEFIFRASGTATLFEGFLKLYDESSEDISEENGNELKIPAGLVINQQLNLEELIPNQHFTKPPPRYTESSLIKELESNGIGRPSTYALIVSTILDRGYVEIADRKLIPTTLGKKVNSILIKNFPNIFDVGFTAKMEEELDLIADGEIDYIKVLNDFYIPFSETLSKVESNLEKIKCEKCGSEMELKIGRYGKFLACKNYPDCKNIKSLKELNNDNNNEPKFTGETCPKCGARTVFREGKFGKFIGCEKYPECDYTTDVTTGIQCPKCNEGELTPRKTKKGRLFYGCSRYPDCDYATWKLPKSEDEVTSDEEEFV